jgi:hypothetical protein
MKWPPRSKRTQGLLFGLAFGGIASAAFGATGEFGWPLAVLTGASLGVWGGANFTKEVKASGDRDFKTIDTRRWEFYALILVPLLTIPVLFAVDSLLLTMSVWLILAPSSLFLLRRLRTGRSPDHKEE